MAITRRGYHELSRSKSRCLRSRVITPTATAVRAFVQKSQQPHMNCVNGGTESKSNDKNLLGKPVAIGSEIGPNLDAISLLIGHSRGAMCDEPEVFDNPTVQNGLISPRLTSAPPPSSPLNHETAEKEGSAVTETSYVTLDATEGGLVLDPDDVGIPNEGKWDLINAYKFRFCFEHGQKEWLLHCTDRWMRPSDFNVYEAKTKLEIKLQKYQREPWSLEPDLLNSQAECARTLWSHLDTPMQRGKLGDEDIYLCRWKFCWTPERNVADKDWAQASCRAQDQSIGRRRSARIEDTAAYREAKFKQMMDVINLEN